MDIRDIRDINLALVMNCDNKLQMRPTLYNCIIMIMSEVAGHS